MEESFSVCPSLMMESWYRHLFASKLNSPPWPPLPPGVYPPPPPLLPGPFPPQGTQISELGVPLDRRVDAYLRLLASASSSCSDTPWRSGLQLSRDTDGRRSSTSGLKPGPEIGGDGEGPRDRDRETVPEVRSVDDCVSCCCSERAADDDEDFDVDEIQSCTTSDVVQSTAWDRCTPQSNESPTQPNIQPEDCGTPDTKLQGGIKKEPETEPGSPEPFQLPLDLSMKRQQQSPGTDWHFETQNSNGEPMDDADRRRNCSEEDRHETSSSAERLTSRGINATFVIQTDFSYPYVVNFSRVFLVSG